MKKHIWLLGGGRTLRAFLEADLIDRWQLHVVPVVLGSGIPFLPKLGFRVRDMSLIRTKSYPSGVVELCYERA
jgi:dihydrofolate reductase